MNVQCNRVHFMTITSHIIVQVVTIDQRMRGCPFWRALLFSSRERPISFVPVDIYPQPVVFISARYVHWESEETKNRLKQQ